MNDPEGYFDFQEKNELPPQIDFNKLIACPHCKKPIPQDSTMCLYCGESVDYIRPKSKLSIIIISFIILIFLAWFLFMT
jgi:predicted nucleic acid-binding Zn ribbon protein